MLQVKVQSGIDTSGWGRRKGADLWAGAGFPGPQDFDAKEETAGGIPLQAALKYDWGSISSCKGELGKSPPSNHVHLQQMSSSKFCSSANSTCLVSTVFAETSQGVVSMMHSYGLHAIDSMDCKKMRLGRYWMSLWEGRQAANFPAGYKIASLLRLLRLLRIGLHVAYL